MTDCSISQGICMVLMYGTMCHLVTSTISSSTSHWNHFLLRNCLCLLTLQSLMISRTAAHQCMDQFHAQPQHFAQVIMYKHKITSLFTPLLLGYAMQSVVYWIQLVLHIKSNHYWVSLAARHYHYLQYTKYSSNQYHSPLQLSWTISTAVSWWLSHRTGLPWWHVHKTTDWKTRHDLYHLPVLWP